MLRAGCKIIISQHCIILTIAPWFNTYTPVVTLGGTGGGAGVLSLEQENKKVSNNTGPQITVCFFSYLSFYKLLIVILNL